MSNAIVSNARAIVAIVAISVYAFCTMLVPASSANFARPSTPCHMTTHHVAYTAATVVEHGQSTKTDAGRGKIGFPNGPDCKLACAMAVMPRMTSAFAARSFVTNIFAALAQNADDWRPAPHGRPPKPVA